MIVQTRILIFPGHSFISRSDVYHRRPLPGTKIIDSHPDERKALSLHAYSQVKESTLVCFFANSRQNIPTYICVKVSKNVDILSIFVIINLEGG